MMTNLATQEPAVVRFPTGTGIKVPNLMRRLRSSMFALLSMAAAIASSGLKKTCKEEPSTYPRKNPSRQMTVGIPRLGTRTQ